MLVREVMTTDAVTATAGTSIKEALGLLAKLGITAMPVVDGKGRLLGVVSEADLIEDVVRVDPEESCPIFDSVLRVEMDMDH